MATFPPAPPPLPPRLRPAHLTQHLTTTSSHIRPVRTLLLLRRTSDATTMNIKRHLRAIILCSNTLTCCAFHGTPRSCVIYPIGRRHQGSSSIYFFSDSKQSTPDDIITDEATGTSQDVSNPIKSFMANFMLQNEKESDEKIETEEEKLRRQKLERLAEIEAGEVRRQQRVSEDKLGYLFLFLLQFLPLIGSDRVLSIA